MWHSPLDLILIPTSDSESFADFSPGETGLPLTGHPGSFGYVRKNHTHEGVDLYCCEGTAVRAVEEGVVVAVMPFTGPHAGSPWWLDTWAVLIEGDSGVVVYGEITTDLWVGDIIQQGEYIGHVKQVLRHDKGRPMSMLHLELHDSGTTDVYEWGVDGDKPESLRDPTPFLRETVDELECYSSSSS